METDGFTRLSRLYCMKCGKILIKTNNNINNSNANNNNNNEVNTNNKRIHPRYICSDSSCKWIYYNNPIPVVAAIIEYTDSNNNTNILLARGKNWPSNWFGIITGFLEPNESGEEGLLREINEELGLDINDCKIVKLIGNYVFERNNQLILAYHVKCKGIIKLNLDELAEYKLVPIQKLKPWNFGTGQAVKDFIKQYNIHNNVNTTIESSNPTVIKSKL